MLRGGEGERLGDGAGSIRWRARNKRQVKTSDESDTQQSNKQTTKKGNVNTSIWGQEHTPT